MALSASASAQSGILKKKKTPWIVILVGAGRLQGAAPARSRHAQGAGHGGLAVAQELDNYLEEHPDVFKVVVVDRNHSFVPQGGSQFVLRPLQSQLATRSRPDQVSASVSQTMVDHAIGSRGARRPRAAGRSPSPTRGSASSTYSSFRTRSFASTAPATPCCAARTRCATRRWANVSPAQHSRCLTRTVARSW
jgi:hypothetical protein